MRPAFTPMLVALALASSSAEALAQTYFYGVEPNNTKFEASPAFGIRAGDQLLVPVQQYLEPGIFRLRHASATPGIYRHSLQPLFGGLSMSFAVLGRDAVTDFVYPQSLAIAQGTGGGGLPSPLLAWYGFGKSEEVFVDIAAAYSGRGPAYLPVRLDTTTVAEVDLGVVSGPSLWFSAVGVGSARDLELHIFDAEYNALPQASVDESVYLPLEPWLNFNLAPGTYHIAVADHASASHLPPGAHDRRYTKTVLDFAGGFINDDPATAYDVEVAVRMNFSSTPLASAVATKVLPFEVLWFRVQVGVGQATASFCPGDGSAGACACYGASPPNSGMGCVNTTGRGATLIATDHAFANPRPWRITLEDLPPSTVALGFLGLQTNAGVPVLAGLNCMGPGAVRAGPWQANLAGTASVPAYMPSASGFLVGQTVHMQAVYRDFFAFGGCQLNFTSGFSFMVR